MPILQELDYTTSEARNITVPPSWPTLSQAELVSDADPFANPTFGAAVLAQTTLVTEDDSREQLIESVFEISGLEDQEIVHDSATTDDEGGLTCWAHVRLGRPRPAVAPEHEAVVLFAGPEIASSGLIITAPGSFTDIPTVTGDLVESVCGTRPEGV